MGHLRRLLATRLQLQRQARENTSYLLAAPRLDCHWMGKAQRVKDAIRGKLRQSLHAEIALLGYATDDIAGLIDWRGNESVRSTTSEGDVDVAKDICLR